MFSRPQPHRLAGAALALAMTALPAVAAETLGPVTDDIGVVRIARGQPIQIGGLLVLSGPDLSLGTDEMRGAKIAFADAKEMVAGHPIRFTVEDAGCSAEGGQTAATRLAANRAIVAVIGPSCSSEGRAGGPILWNAGIPQVDVGGTAPSLTAPDRPEGLKGLVRVVYNDLAAARVAVEYAIKGANAKTAATLHDGSTYAEQVVRAFEAGFEAAGGKIIAKEAIGSSDTDLRPVLTRIGTSPPDLLFMPLYVGGAAYAVRQAKDVPSLSKTVLLASDSVLAPAFLEAAGSAAVGFRLIGVDASPEALGPRYVEFRKKYVQMFGEEPISGFHAYGYDGGAMLLAAIEKVAVKGSDSATYIGRKALRDALASTKDFDGITGRLTCDQYGDCGTAKFAIFEYVNGDPKTYREGTNPKRVYP
jgi:branched-chain amino acid transport system substrate-binding protein